MKDVVNEIGTNTGLKIWVDVTSGANVGQRRPPTCTCLALRSGVVDWQVVPSTTKICCRDNPHTVQVRLYLGGCQWSR